MPSHMSVVLLETTIDPTTRWLALGAAALTIAYAVFRPMMRRKDPLAKRPASSNSLAGQRAVERDMSNLLVELSEMARQITAQIDTRAGKLEALIREADEKIAALRAVAPPAAASPFTIPPATAAPTLDREVPPNPEHADVYALADDGKSPRDIAAQLGRPDGEIELILALRLAR
jgi:hypothetical protein